jgi:hypothetical protein
MQLVLDRLVIHAHPPSNPNHGQELEPEWLQSLVLIRQGFEKTVDPRLLIGCDVQMSRLFIVPN